MVLTENMLNNAVNEVFKENEIVEVTIEYFNGKSYTILPKEKKMIKNHEKGSWSYINMENGLIHYIKQDYILFQVKRLYIDYGWIKKENIFLGAK